jgi:hypothetical protein
VWEITVHTGPTKIVGILHDSASSGRAECITVVRAHPTVEAGGLGSNGARFTELALVPPQCDNEDASGWAVVARVILAEAGTSAGNEPWLVPPLAIPLGSLAPVRKV